MGRLAVTGASGRMGREVLAAADERDGVDVVLAVNRGSDRQTVGNVPVEDAADLPALLAEREPNAFVDFTGPESSVEYVEAAAEAGVAAVVGTTGFEADHLDRLRAASERVPVLRAANFSRGVQALLAAVREAAARLPGYDVEVTETHHDGKRDAPSGTARTLVGAVEEAPRSEGEIGIHARRAGGVNGEHEVLLAGEQEVVTLAHRANDRRVFADGALDAAEWLAGRDPGWYEFADVVADAPDGAGGEGGDRDE
ncbi:4-hydroxy-tetrahydrodipicolinate reductase [Halobacteriales archaeon QS_1_68_20]|nr:MAG: 4-hydroxy-tetrahydrodipicolinate reductase [Halobacteriales archaeon QS_1_68_20]